MMFFFLDGSALAKRYVIEVGSSLIDYLLDYALAHIPKHSVNSTDAIALHASLGLAKGFRTRGDDLTLVASDQRLIRAATAEGMSTFNPEIQDLALLTALVGP